MHFQIWNLSTFSCESKREIWSTFMVQLTYIVSFLQLWEINLHCTIWDSGHIDIFVLARFHHFHEFMIFERATFNMRKQEPSEPDNAFITDLHCLSENCEFGVLREELMRDRIMVGLQDVKLSEKLQMDSSVTQQTAINKARQNESLKKQQEILWSGSTEPPASLKVDEVNKAKGKQDGRPRGPTNKKHEKCMQCSSTSENHLRQKCPARDATCVRCNKRDHFAKVCLLVPKKVKEITVDSVDEQDETGHMWGIIQLNKAVLCENHAYNRAKRWEAGRS